MQFMLTAAIKARATAINRYFRSFSPPPTNIRNPLANFHCWLRPTRRPHPFPSMSARGISNIISPLRNCRSSHRKTAIWKSKANWFALSSTGLRVSALQRTANRGAIKPMVIWSEFIDGRYCGRGRDFSRSNFRQSEIPPIKPSVYRGLTRYLPMASVGNNGCNCFGNSAAVIYLKPDGGF